MKVPTLLIAIPYFFPKKGGLENYAYNIAKGLMKRFGWRIIVVTSNHLGTSYEESIVDGMIIYRLPIALRLSNTPVHFGWYGELVRIIKKERPTIVNGHTPVPFMADVAALAAKKCGVPFVLTYQNDLEKSSFILTLVIAVYSLVLRLLTLQIAKRIIVTTAYFREQSPTLRSVSERIAIIPPGVELPVKQLSKESGPSVLFVGSLDKTHMHKGIPYLLQAVAQVHTTIPAITLTVAGKGDAISDYRDQASTLGIDDCVRFTGFVTDDQLDALFRSCSVVVLPSTNNSEGFGMVLIEGGAYGKPVIGTRVGGIPYVIDDGKTGILVRPADVPDLAKALETILGSPPFAKKLGENGFKKISEGYLWEQQVSRTHQLFSSL